MLPKTFHENFKELPILVPKDLLRCSQRVCFTILIHFEIGFVENLSDPHSTKWNYYGIVHPALTSINGVSHLFVRWENRVLIWFSVLKKILLNFFFLNKNLLSWLLDFVPTKIDLVVYLWTVTRIWSFFFSSFPMIVKQAWKRKGRVKKEFPNVKSVNYADS